MAEVGQAYLQIIPSMRGMGPAITREMSGIGDTVTKDMGSGLISGLSSSFNTIASVGVKAVGTIGAAVGGLAVGGGISRALKIDQATYKFEQMGIDVESAMASCNEAVRGTAYGLDAAATVAASLGASGVQAGDQMTNALKATAGMAAMSGRSMEEVGLIFGKVAAQGRLQGDELMQFAENGVNATAALASYLGKTQAEVRDMVSAGEIDFQTFSDAMYATFGEAAQGANATFQGAASNVMAALSRMGAKFADPALSGLREVFVAIIPAVDALSAALEPLVGKFSDMVDSGVSAMVPAIEAFTAALQSGAGPVEAFGAAFSTLPDGAQRAIEAFGAVAAVIGGGAVAGKISSAASKIWGVAKSVGGFASSAAGVIGSLVSEVSRFGFAFLNPITFVRSALPGLGTAFTALSGPIGIAIAAAVALGAAIAYLWNTNEPFRQQMTELGETLMASLAPAFETVMQAVSQLADTALPAVMQIVSALVPVVAAIVSLIAQVVQSLAPVIVLLASSLVPVISTVVSIAAQVISMVAAIVSQIVAAVMPSVMMVVNAVSAYMPIVLSVITVVLSAVLQIFNAVWPAISTVVQIAMTAISTVINVVMPIIQGIITAVMAIIRGDWQGAWDAIQSALSSAWEAIKQGVSSGIEAVVQFFTDLPGNILNTLSGIGSWLKDAGADLVQGLIDGIMGAVGGIGDALLGGARDAVNAFKGFFGIASPSKLMKSLGVFTMEGLAIGYDDGAKLPVKAMRSTMSTISSIADQKIPAGSILAWDRYDRTSGYAMDQRGANVQQNYNIYANDPNLVASVVAERQYRSMMGALA